jgi:hypothetical protein
VQQPQRALLLGREPERRGLVLDDELDLAVELRSGRDVDELGGAAVELARAT